MNVCINTVTTELETIINYYERLNQKLHLDVDDNTKYTFNNQSELIRVLVACRSIMVDTLKTYTYISEGTKDNTDFKRIRDLYKRSNIKVSDVIIYHDLKNVFEILDIAASDKSGNLTTQNISASDLDNIYAAMCSFILKTIKICSAKFGGIVSNG